MATLPLATLACGDDPFALDWRASPDTVRLYSLARPELNLPSAYDFAARVALRIEAAAATGRWDMAIDTEQGGLVFVPPGVLGVDSEAGIAEAPGSDFVALEDAPSDTAAYAVDRSVPIRVGGLYVVRTHEQISTFGQRCNFYAKLEVLEADEDLGTVTFQFDASPLCNSRRLIPPD